MCFVLCQVSSIFDSQRTILHLSGKHLKLITQVCREMEKPFACVIVYALTKCFGIISAQQICKHCQRVWIGAANLGSSALITVNWWTDMFALLWKHAWADTSNMSAVMNDAEMQSFIVAVFPECASLLRVKPVAREDFGNSWCFTHSCVCEPLCVLVTRSTPRAGALLLKDKCLSGIFTC